MHMHQHCNEIWQLTWGRQRAVKGAGQLQAQALPPGPAHQRAKQSLAALVACCQE